MTALSLMHDRAIAARSMGNHGYVTTTGELKAILAELTQRAPLRIEVFDDPHGPGAFRYVVDLAFTLDPAEEPRSSNVGLADE